MHLAGRRAAPRADFLDRVDPGLESDQVHRPVHDLHHNACRRGRRVSTNPVEPYPTAYDMTAGQWPPLPAENATGRISSLTSPRSKPSPRERLLRQTGEPDETPHDR